MFVRYLLPHWMKFYFIRGMKGGGLMAKNEPAQMKDNQTTEQTVDQAKNQLLEIGKKRGVLA